jgi:hypothetical protein
MADQTKTDKLTFEELMVSRLAMAERHGKTPDS